MKWHSCKCKNKIGDRDVITVIDVKLVTLILVKYGGYRRLRISDLAFKLKLLFEDSDLNLFLRNQALERAKYFPGRNVAARMISFFDDVLKDQKKPAKTIENIHKR